MQINEIYLSINGEAIATGGDHRRGRVHSRRALLGIGVPTIFVRTHSCHIQCVYCDTAFSWDGSESRGHREIPDVLKEIEKVSDGFKSILLTGGEPGIQRDITLFCHAVKEAGYTLAVETAGGCDIDVFGLDPRPDSIILDIKGPSSGKKAMEISWRPSNVAKLRPCDQIKFVIADQYDWNHMISILDEFDLALLDGDLDTEPIVIASPLFDMEGNHQAKEVIKWILGSRRNIVCGIQVHKLIWSPKTREV